MTLALVAAACAGCRQDQDDLFVKAALGDKDAFNRYLAQGADPNKRLGGGRTLLIVAAQRDDWYMFQALLKHGAQVNVLDHDSITPLMWAAGSSRPAMVKQLIESGADVEMRDAWQNNAIWHAVGGDPENIYLLAVSGADVNNVNTHGETPLLKALELYRAKGVGYVSIATLLSLGARADSTNSAGETALSLAMEIGDTNVVQLFLQER